MGKREAVTRKGSRWQEREQAQADKGACRGTQGARRSRQGSIQRHTTAARRGSKGSMHIQRQKAAVTKADSGTRQSRQRHTLRQTAAHAKADSGTR